MRNTEIKLVKCLVKGLALRKCLVIVSCCLVRHFQCWNIQQGFLQEILHFFPQARGRKTFPLISPFDLTAFYDMPCALTTDISIIWPKRRDQECGKSKTAAKAQILYV